MTKIDDIKNTIICGDTLKELRKIPNECIDMIITSPPYWGLRNYGVDGQLGLEPTFEEFVKKFLEITAEIKRVLKKTGSFWMNFGDSYGGAPAGNKSISKANIGYSGVFVQKMKQGQGAKSFVYSTDNERMFSGNKNTSRLKQTANEKCLLMQPERIAIKLIDEQGFILRNKIKWCKQVYLAKEKMTKGGVMPTSVRDRFNESGEELYFFVKNKKYYSNLDAVRLPNQVLGVTDFRASGLVRSAELYPNSKYAQAENQGKIDGRISKHIKNGENQSRTQRIPKQDLVGNPTYTGFNKRWKEKIKYDISERQEELKDGGLLPATQRVRGFFDEFGGQSNPAGKNLPSCWLVGSEPHNFQNELGIEIDHFATFPQELLKIPIKFACPSNGIVLDPFMGSGTTAIIAEKLGRNYIGIDINPEYCKMAEKRIYESTKQLKIIHKKGGDE